MDNREAATAVTYRPYVPANVTMTELTFRGVVVGSLLGIIFAASSVYLALKVGLTVSAVDPDRGPLDHHLPGLRQGHHPREQHRPDGRLGRRVDRRRRGLHAALAAAHGLRAECAPGDCWSRSSAVLGRADDDPAPARAHRRGARQAHLPRGHGLRRRAHRGRDGRDERQDRALGGFGVGPLLQALGDDLSSSSKEYPNFDVSPLVKGELVRRALAGDARRRLHHRPAHVADHDAPAACSPTWSSSR